MGKALVSCGWCPGAPPQDRQDRVRWVAVARPGTECPANYQEYWDTSSFSALHATPVEADGESPAELNLRPDMLCQQLLLRVKEEDEAWG